MTSGARAPTTKERENNKRRERKRRAIAARIFAGLRQFGNYKLPKHCDNNEVLKALCREAGWIVEEDGTTYKQGCRPPPVERSDVCMSSTASPASSSYNQAAAAAAPSDGVSLIPWLKGLSSSGVTMVAPGMNAVGPSSSTRNPSLPPLQIMRGGTCSAPVTPPLSSPRMPAVKPEWGAPDGSSSRGGGGGDAMSLDCAATAFSNAFHSQFPFMTAASGTSTPTYPPAFIVSGASTPTHFGLASGASTPFLPSGASTPTHSSSLNVLRNVSFHFAAVANNPFVATQDRESSANPHVLDAIPVQKDKLANMESHGDSVVKEITEKLASNVAMADVKASVSTPVGLKRPAPQGQIGSISGADQTGLWPPIQSEQVITAQLAAAVPDARNIVPENFRTDVEMDVARRRQRMKSYLVKPWEGETIHEVSIEEDDLELTLGNSTTKAGSTPASSTFNAAMSID